MKKILAMLLALAMVFALAACSSSNAPAATEANKPADKPADSAPAEPAKSGEVPTLVWYTVGGGQPLNYDAWLAQINPYLEEKIGINIDVKVVDWGSWEQRRSVIVSTNEPYDIMFTNGATYAADVALGAFADITDMLNDTPDLKNLLPENFWDSMRVGGKIYGVPAYKDSSMTDFFVWDADIAQQYFPGYKDAHTLTDLDEGVKAIYDGTGVNPLGLHKDGWCCVFDVRFDTLGTGLRPIGIPYNSTDGKIICTLEDEGLMNDLRILHKWYEAGYINQDAPNLDNAPVYKVLSTAQGWPYAAKNVWGPAMGVSDFTGEPVNCEAIQMMDTVLSNETVQGSMLCVSSSSKYPAEALKLIQLINTDSYVRDLLYYGVEGDNWDYVDMNGEKRVHKNNTDWTMAGYTQGTFFNVTLDDTVEFNYWTEVQHQNETAVGSPALGFSFDKTPVANEIGACIAVFDNYKAILFTGSMDPDEIVPKMMDELRANGLDKIIEEAQTQFDAWKAG